MKDNKSWSERPVIRTEGFGLIAWLDKTRIILPLKGVECRFQVCGDLVNVEIDQIYHQENRGVLDCLYTFPLPGDAAVYCCEMHVNDRVIVARVEELDRAIKIVRKKKLAGHRTALVRMERDNLFTLELGNVAPGDVVVIRFAYFQTLTRLDDQASFNIPFNPGVRYIPGVPLLRASSGHGAANDTDQVPDASRITPPRIDKLHPDAAYLSIEGQIDHSKGRATDVRSPSHPLLVKDDGGRTMVSLVDRAAVPDCDLVLRWTELASQVMESAAWLTRCAGRNFALVRLTAPKEVVSVKEHAQDIYFLVDRSGSMAGKKWTQACAAFREFLKTLEPQDRAWATFFDSFYQDLAEKPLPPGALLSEPAVHSLEKICTAGGTELLPALMHVLDSIQRHSKNRNTSIVLLTDGQVGNEAEILKVIRSMPQVRVHTLGIDDAVNDGFLKSLAAQQRGTCYLVTPDDDIVGIVSRLGVRLRRPVLTDIRLRGGWELPEASVPDLHASETLNLPLCGAAEAREIEWEGKLSTGEVQVFRCSVVEQMLPGVPLLWARRRIERLISEDNCAGAIELATQHNLLCDGTAFVAWDESERVVVGQSNLDLYQPSMESSVGGCAPLQTFYDHDPCGGHANQRKTFFSLIGTLDSGKVGSSLLADKSPQDAIMTGGSTLIPTACPPWRVELEKDELLHGRAFADELLGWLENWAASIPSARVEREDKLAELAGLLAQLRHRQEPQMSRLDAMRRWLETTLKDQPEFLRPALKFLHRLALMAQTDHKQLVR